ncbi:MAG: helix-turn-helix domain-containing protein [Sulfurospirillaceae bacterium]|nr:helix-turn-helix domain-containing protein [Sulfurospirillaceae bacterium]
MSIQSNQNLRPKEAAKYLGIGLSTIWLFAKQGKLHPIKLSDRVTLFKKEDLDAFINGDKYES